MIELSRAQDEEVGDGTTSVIILAGEVLSVVEGFLEKEVHPTTIVTAYFQALEDIKKLTNELAIPINMENNDDVAKIVGGVIGTKFASKWGRMVVDLAVKAVPIVYKKEGDNVEIDIKRYAKVEKIPGGMLEECCVLDGVMFNKDITHPGMRRVIKNPRICLLDCPLEYKKGESMTNMEFTQEDDFKKALQMEEIEVKRLCEAILKVKPDIVITEKGVSDLAQHYLLKQGNCTVFRRLRKTDNNRVARASGATIVNRPEELTEDDIGTHCGLFEVKKIGDEYFTFLTECKEPRACSIILRGASKDVLNEIERNLQDALGVCRNVFLNPKVVPGGGALEMELACRLQAKAQTLPGVQQWPYKALASALEVIPRTLASNCGSDVVRTITELRAKHSQDGGFMYGIDGDTGKISNMQEKEIWDPAAVKIQTFKTAIESACMLLRIDDIVSGIKKERNQGGRKAQDSDDEMGEGDTFGDARDG
jgi:T-complex protein 1 subunit gamma